jgi:hypothetical protein
VAHNLRETADALRNGHLAGRSPELHDIASRLESCGTYPIEGVEHVVVKQHPAGHRTIGGMYHCGKHLCPSCGTFNAQRRREKLKELVEANKHAGRHFHAVITLRHHAGVKWIDLATVFRKVWRRMQQSVFWKGRREGVRVVARPSPVLGFVRADEVTHSENNGIHHHIHLLLTLRADTDVDEFKTWFAEFWSAQARKLGRTADWSRQHGWWSEVDPGKLDDAIIYDTKAADPADLERNGQMRLPVSLGARTLLLDGVLAAEVLGGTSKKESAPWGLPPLEFAEVWRDSKGHRWFGVGGIWRSKATEQVETDEGAQELRDELGIVIAAVERWKFASLSPAQRAWITGLAANPALGPHEFLTWWHRMWKVWEQQNPGLKPPHAQEAEQRPLFAEAA